MVLEFVAPSCELEDLLNISRGTGGETPFEHYGEQKAEEVSELTQAVLCIALSIFLPSLSVFLPSLSVFLPPFCPFACPFACTL
jgi:hypothetical protein